MSRSGVSKRRGESRKARASGNKRSTATPILAAKPDSGPEIRSISGVGAVISKLADAPILVGQAGLADHLAPESESRLLSIQEENVGQINSHPEETHQQDIRQPSLPRDTQSAIQSTSSLHERIAMQTKQLFAKFWQRYHNVEEKPSQPICTEPPEDYPSLPVAGGSASDPLFALLSHDDICHAAGILRPRSAYDIDKIVEMLHSDHMCGLPDEIKRASVLMAIEATGSSVHDILQYATRRQEALDAYETAQRKQFADFEARKMQENAQSGAELARVTAHYAERIRGNERLLAAGKDAFRNWRKAKRTESQRIAEVLELCARKPAADPPVQVKARAAAASAGANGITTARLPRPTLPPEPPAVRPN